MITHTQKRILVAMAVIVTISIGLTTIRHQTNLENREAVASVFIGDELAVDYVRMGLGNCEFGMSRSGSRYTPFRKRRAGDFEKCKEIANIRSKALLRALNEAPTPQTCYKYVKPKISSSMNDKAVIAACRYFLDYDYG